MFVEKILTPIGPALVTWSDINYDQSVHQNIFIFPSYILIINIKRNNNCITSNSTSQQAFLGFNGGLPHNNNDGSASLTKHETSHT